PYTVLDLTDHRGELASMVLGDLGADVIKIEPPQGSPSRRLGPFLKDAAEPENSLHFLAFNRNKRGTTLDLTTDAGRNALLRLAQRVDFLIESGHPGEMAGLGLGFDALRQANPHIVYVAISAYGQHGPHAHFAASDLSLAAMGGLMGLQGDPGRPPVRITVPQVWLHASVEAAVGALTAHARILTTGQAQFVDVSAQAAMVWTMLHGMAAHGIQGTDFNRGGSSIQLGNITLPLVYECADGHVVLVTSGATMTKMVHWLVEEGIVPDEWIQGEDWPIYERNLLQQEPTRYTLDEVVDVVRRYVRGHTKRALLERGLQERVTIAPVSTM
ncbi:MAG: CoA transferase, partial [Dehalococcoidia bacterium]